MRERGRVSARVRPLTTRSPIQLTGGGTIHTEISSTPRMFRRPFCFMEIFRRDGRGGVCSKLRVPSSSTVEQHCCPHNNSTGAWARDPAVLYQFECRTYSSRSMSVSGHKLAISTVRIYGVCVPQSALHFIPSVELFRTLVSGYSNCVLPRTDVVLLVGEIDLSSTNDE